MFDNLKENLAKSIQKIKGQSTLTEDNIKSALREVRIALLEADVALPVVKDFIEQVKQRAIGENVITSLKPDQVLIKIVKEELTQTLGAETQTLNLSTQPPAVILMAGLQGAGKTTSTAKLAKYLIERERKKVMVVSADVYRPAAINQLKVLGEQVNVKVYTEEDNKDPVKIAKKEIEHAKEYGHNVVIIDTAGRLAIDEEMMNEITAIKKEVNPQETLFVVDSMTGQDAVNTAKAFNDRLDYEGVVLTKLDGDTRGGAALSIKAIVNKPIKFVGIGEKMDAIDQFHPNRMADRILGMGDIVSLVEKAQEQFDAEEARNLQRKIAKNQFNFDDFLKQIKQIKKMGNVKDLMGMIPGVGKAIKNMDIDDDAFKGIEAIIYSMTPEERNDPKILNGSRRRRIAVGSGTDIQEVNQLIKQFAETQKMMKMMTGGRGKNLMRAMSNMKNVPGR